MVVQGLFAFASSLALAAIAVAGVCYTFNYINNRYLHEQDPSRATSSNNKSSKSWKGYDDWNEITCTICLIDVSNARLARRVLECGHMFHKKCIEGWFSHTKSCPNCREPAL